MTDNQPASAGHNRLGALAAEIAQHHGAASAATVDGATLVTCKEAVRRLQEMGLSALDAHAGAVRYLHLRLVKELVEIATDLAEVQMRLPPEQWPLWLRASFGWSTEDAALLIEAAAAAKAGQDFDVEAVAGALMTLDRAT
jgi:hypothetical protein